MKKTSKAKKVSPKKKFNAQAYGKARKSVFGLSKKEDAGKI